MLTPLVGAMGKVTQLAFGALSPGNVNVNLMSANVTAGAATSAADLLTDFEERLPAWREPASAVSCPVRWHLCRYLIVSVLTFAVVLVPNAAGFSAPTSSQRLPPRPGLLLRSRSVKVCRRLNLSSCG